MTVPQIVNEVILPRKYQEEIFRRAQETNVIAALDTGSGKTFISILLIKWIVLQEKARNKVIVFLVPKVALVEQQANFIVAHTPLRVKKFHGSLDLELTDRANWKKSFEESDVVVMTAQIFLNILTHSHWRIEKVSLIIFDECHHTRKNHAYNGIMREYFQIPSYERPKVFGMTASPIWNPKDAEGSLLTLEKNLDATVIAVREHVSELLENSPRPAEIIKEYFPSPENYLYLHPSLWDCLSLFDHDIDLPWDKLEMKYHATRNSLGPYCADLFLYHDVKGRVLQILNDLEAAAKESEPVGFDDDAYYRMDPKRTFDIPPNLEQIDSILSEYSAFFEDPASPLAVPIPVPLAWCSPKVKALAEVLLEHHSETFHGIIFVEQRQIAACLAKILSCIPELRGRIRCAELVGHGSGHNHRGKQAASASTKGMGLARQQDIVRGFRDGSLNLLVATSVAEEGLDFPACDIVIRFDPLHHMVGYVQSRGRARTKTSTFVIMVQAGHAAHLDRYKVFLESEPELKRVYQSRENPTQPVTPDSDEESEEGEIEEEDPTDLAARERYIVPSTGAVLTYGSAIGLLNYLCSLIPHDAYTPAAIPRYSGDYAAIVELPSSLPLPIDRLIFRGPERCSKREAKRAVAFLAVKELHKMDVFDDYLLPSTNAKGRNTEDADGRKIADMSEVPDIMNVSVRDPWTLGPILRLHVISIDGVDVAGLVTGTELPPVEITSDGCVATLRYFHEVNFPADEKWEKVKMLNDFTTMGTWFCITGRPIPLPLTCFLVPLTSDNHIDFDNVQQVVTDPYGTYNWKDVTEKDYGHTMIMNSNQYGRALILRNIRHDLTALSIPPPYTREAICSTYQEFFVQRWTRKNREAFVPTNCPLIEVSYLPRHPSGLYRPADRLQDIDKYKRHSASTGFLVPLGACRRTHFSENLYRTFLMLPRICRRVSDVYRARQERLELGLPPIPDDLLIEASTLPTTSATWNNQRLETLGDSVLKLATTVHVMNKYPHRHEGQLSQLRQSSISNRTLLARAKEIGLERFLTSEGQSLHSWRYVVPEGADLLDPFTRPARHARREFPRRSLQDCMEATLGAAFLHGGIDMALRTGDALGMTFGGALPWSFRYGRQPEPSRAPPLFADLQANLGYEFHRGDLLVEAATHPSFVTSSGPSYQRLEFLGDAMIDLVVMRYLFDKFPEATSGQLSAARSRAVCGPTLASVSVKRLSLHKHLLINNVELSTTINRHVPLLESLTAEDAVNKGWKYDPPKALSDVLESVIGAVLVDTAYNFEKTAAIVEFVMSDILEILTTDLPRDPVSELMIWAACAGCRRISFQQVKSQSSADMRRNDSISVVVHDVVVIGPITAANLPLSKGLAAERARILLDDASSDRCLAKLCDCMKVLELPPRESFPENPVESNPSADETEEGFANIAKQKLVEDLTNARDEPEAYDENVLDDAEVYD
ncbi:P-loop containing nucleoside triphosphate hydrolase protein [Leucogyrophana mollusca]|uniref:P-loop containing nucleoside triphosphate hydrolase protein n=1 Tax=Leucogyrophana mollusca TaxID=85980 RepID=A0ACB8BRM2_9AGAM|nr:P-loop containing nucleoside triphosphate hydrolase protein [Leucogyrophana mollusca]